MSERNRMRLAGSAFFCFYSFLVAPGCATVATEAAKKAFESRSSNDQLLDTKIAAGIMERLGGKDKSLLLDVSADAWEQRVMLTGALDNAKTIEEVVRLTKEDSRIKKVYNEIQLVSPADKERRRNDKKSGDKKETGVGQSVNDFWIETKISAQLLTTKKVTSVNYRWRSVLNNVYVIGKAENSFERDLVLNVVKGVEGIKAVKDFIEVRPRNVDVPSSRY